MTRITRWLMLCGIIMCTACVSNPRYYPISQSTSEQIIISERVGEVVDAEERAYYNLFQGITGFQEAVFFRVSNYGFDAVITTDNHTYIYSNRDSVAVATLREYIERYEDPYFMPKMFEQKWKIVGYDDLGFAITEYEVKKITGYNLPVLFGTCGCLTGGCIGGIIGNNATPSHDCGPAYMDKIYRGIAIGGTSGCLVSWYGTKVFRDRHVIHTMRQHRQLRILE